MLFLNTWMLLGLLGIAIPVIIHLLNRRQSKHVDWGAMIFLMDSMTSRRRRVLLEEILLLAARCLLMALVALALARPFIPAYSTVPWLVVLPAGLLAIVLGGVSFALWNYPVWRRRAVWTAVFLALLAIGAVVCERWLNLRHLGHGGARDVALVVDGSSSMTMSIDGHSNFSRAIQEATRVVETSPRGFAFSLIIGGSVPNVLTPSPMSDRKRLLQMLQEAVPVQGTMQAPDTLAVAAAVLAQGENPAKQIVLIGDGQSVGWKTDSPETWDHLREAFARLPVPPQIILRRLPLPATIRNASLASISLSRQVLGTDREVRIDVTVANTGTEAITPQEVRLTIGDKTQTNHALGQLAPGASETISFRHQFTRAGAEVIRAAVVANDELPGDDEAIRVVTVMSRLHVLIVDANPATRFLDRPGAFLALALMPSLQGLSGSEATGAGNARADFLVEPEVVSLAEFAGRQALGDVKVVVLADVPQLPTDTAAVLTAFTAQGGGLLVATGARANPVFYNAWRGDAGNIMPLPLDRLVATSGETNRPTLDLRTFEHAALKPLAGASDLASASFARYWQTGTADDGVRIGARLNNGAPFLAERHYGRGCILQVTAPLDASAGNLVARQGFVPLVHELVYALAHPITANLNLQPSRGATIQLAGHPSTVGSENVQGLRGEYFTSKDQYAGGIVRIDPTINFEWHGAPVDGLPADRFWVQWTGSIVVPVSGSYKFFSPTNGSFSLWVDSRRLLSPQELHGTIMLTTGHRHDLRVDYIAATGAHTPRLVMSGPTIARQVLPARMLSPMRGDAETWSAGVETLVQGPDKQPFPGRYVTSADGVALRVDRNLVPGLYHAQAANAVLSWLDGLLDKDGALPFSVLVDGQESRLATLTPEEIQTIGKFVPFLTAADADDVARAMGGKSFGRELWRILALAAFCLLILEILLTRWIAIQRRTGEEGAVDFDEQTASSASFRQQLAQMRGGAAGAKGTQ